MKSSLTEGKKCVKFQSTQPKRAATVRVCFTREVFPCISIHAAQEGCDCACRIKPTATLWYFNPRSPRGLRPPMYVRFVWRNNISIHAAQEGCDCESFRHCQKPSGLISIHAAQEGCDCVRHKDFRLVPCHISIHAAQEGCDCGFVAVCSVIFQKFQSTQPKRAATVCGLGPVQKVADGISIHAAQEGCDVLMRLTKQAALLFQSTQPKRAATVQWCF